MNLRRQRAEEPDINLTPLIDVVFLLLIFFMVSTTFKHDSELAVELPEASAEPVTHTEKPLELVIDAEGRFFIGDKELVNRKLNTVKQALTDAAGDNRQQPLVIRADGKTPHQAVVTAMDAAGQIGFKRLSIATVRTESKDQQ